MRSWGYAVTGKTQKIGNQLWIFIKSTTTLKGQMSFIFLFLIIGIPIVIAEQTKKIFRFKKNEEYMFYFPAILSPMIFLPFWLFSSLYFPMILYLITVFTNTFLIGNLYKNNKIFFMLPSFAISMAYLYFQIIALMNARYLDNFDSVMIPFLLSILLPTVFILNGFVNALIYALVNKKISNEKVNKFL